MWLIQALNNELQKRMETGGLEIGSEVIYSENEASLKDAVVSLDFGCTGSMISNKGLLITNHHCAYDDIFNLSTPENNLLENGYWAKKQLRGDTCKRENHLFPKKSGRLHKRIEPCQRFFTENKTAKRFATCI